MLERMNPRSNEMTTGYRPRYNDPMDRLFDRFFGGFGADGEELSNRRWMPATDIRESDDHYEVIAELPGMTKDDIDITLENNLLTLSGERRFEREKEKENYHRIERSYGTFSRSFTLPRNVDPNKVNAKFDDGILTLTIPKSEEGKPRRISVQ